MSVTTYPKTPAGGSAPAGNGPARALLRRWPTALALALTVPGLFSGGDGDPDGAVDAFGEALPLLPLLYLIVAQAGRPRWTWPVLGAGVAVMVVLRTTGLVAPSTVLVAVAAGLLLWGAVRGTPHGGAVFGLQSAGAVLFCGLAVAGLAVDPDLGRYLVAAGWFFHGVWDFVHLRMRGLDGIVSRTFAEWCGVVDVVIAAELLFAH
ncbi:hypothetical protein DMB38_35005 [Streptomyces sp. WAC 06738]|uniref:hypothetical protein n=1 Tax=Streptomyces sp. WAC 06738 TaxID=2203210 RepID=UPI000F6EE61F|nr:hypothetical protein [Streptomyces sp. WAC 06738]AZM50302.1 hypothetical protein DMB38_35005 [Streptomyces sp. WAC 06738]